MRRERWKYLEAPAEDPARELYDLSADPGETRNLAELEPDRTRRLSALIADWRASAEAVGPSPTVSPEDRRRLEALGYHEPEAGE